MKFHVLAGLPRAGSTVLGAILSQNPKFYVSPTSTLGHVIGMMSTHWSVSPEIKAALARDKAGTEKRIDNALRSVIWSWYRGRKPVVFDKCRGWHHYALILKRLYPEAKILLPIRDLRDIFATIEKEHMKNPVLDPVEGPIARTVETRASNMFSPDGIIGLPINGISDILDRRPGNALVVQFETFVQNPKLIMEKIYTFLGEPYFEHIFDNIEEDSEDSGFYDAIHLNKFPHTVHSKIEPRTNGERQKYVGDRIQKLIMERYPGYNRAFGYS